jgi:hypothetical protein
MAVGGALILAGVALALTVENPASTWAWQRPDS